MIIEPEPKIIGPNPRSETMLRRLDYVTTPAAILIGFGLGVALVLASRHLPLIVFGFVFIIGLAAMVLLAFSGRPVVNLESIYRERLSASKRETEPASDTEEIASGMPPSKIRHLADAEMVPIRAGTFQMGSSEQEEGRLDHEGPMHAITVTSYECMQYLVTRRLYAELMGKDPGWPEGEADTRPVNNVSWFDAVRFCNALSNRMNLTPCYSGLETQEVVWDDEADGYRMPTEAEWEYVARAGTQTAWCFGDDESELEKYGWFYKKSDSRVHPIGKLEANLWGLYDMHGNLYEWCWDWYGAYNDEPQTNPDGAENGESRVLRGGAFFDVPRDLRSAFRYWDEPEFSDWGVGFRCVRGPRRQP